MSASHVLRYVITKTRAQIKIKSDFLPGLLLLAFTSPSCLIYKFISKHTRDYARCYELMC